MSTVEAGAWRSATPEIEDCACGQDHQTMPMIDISTCWCVWGDEDDPECTPEVIWVEAVCREHKRHVPCRTCMREEES